MPHVRHQHALAAESATHILGSINKRVASRYKKGSDPSPLFGTCKTVSGLPCPVLVFSLQKDSVFLESVYARVTEMVRGLENVMSQERLRTQPDHLGIEKAKRKLCS